MWNAPGGAERGRRRGEKELRELSTISDYKENVGRDKTSQLWAVTRRKSHLYRGWDWRVRVGVQSSVASSTQASSLTCPGM